MTDVIQIAQERRAQLRAELQKLEEFLRMAETLTRDTDAPEGAEDADSMPSPGEAADKSNGSSALRTNLFRQSGSGA